MLGPDEATCRARARHLWLWSLPGWHVMAGFTHLALVQVGAENQAGFLRWAERELLPELRKLG